jgi:mannosyltransferase
LRKGPSVADLIVTNFNRNFTGVSATAAGVVRQQMARYDMALAGHALPGCPAPIDKRAAYRVTRIPPDTHPFTIWHVRRNTEMRAALWARDVLRLPVKIIFTSAAQRRHSALPRWLISRMDAVIATTERAAEFVPHVRAVVPHGVDTERFSPAPDRDQAWANTGHPGTKGIATIGRIRLEKGTDHFVAAMLSLLPDHPGLTALAIGRAAKSDQAFLGDLKSQIAKAGLTDRILFPGEVAPDDLPALMQALTAVVQLPRYEGYGMTPLEGMASGVPFVASDAGYYRNFSGQGQCGLIVDPEAAADALSTLLADPDRHAAISRAARSAADTHFSIQTEVDGIGAIYEQLWAGS